MTQCFDYKTFLADASPLPGVYQMYNAQEKIIYVGKAKNLKNRLSSYFNKNVAPKTAALVKQIHHINTTITHTETEALILENTLIKKHLPRYNILLRDDKSYPYIFLSNHRYPRLSFHRGAKKKKGHYFGPYPSAGSVRESLRLLQKVFPVRQCEDSFFSHRSRPCLQAQIGRCTAPCVGAISPQDYAKDTENAVLFLNGKSQEVTNALQTQMAQASKTQSYENAAKFRDQIAHLRHVQEKQFVENLSGNFDVLAIAHSLNHACIQLFVYRNGQSLGNRAYFMRQIKDQKSEAILGAFLTQHYLNNHAPHEIITNLEPTEHTTIQDALSFESKRNISIRVAQRGEKVQLIKNAITNAKLALQDHINTKTSILQQMDDLQAVCDLDLPPKHIECFDISHTMGEATVASCVVFKNGEASKADYRTFNIKGIKPGDDYAAILQALTRRYTRLIKSEALLPDLLIVDGGKGQMTQAKTMLNDLQISIPLMGVAKGPLRQAGKETLLLSQHDNPDHIFTIKENNPAFLLIQKIRDEAHRFAITGHRGQRNKKRVTSSLQEIAGIGAKRRQVLLHHFGGLQELKKAGVLDLAKVKGISAKKAQDIYDYFHQ